MKVKNLKQVIRELLEKGWFVYFYRQADIQKNEKYTF